MNTIKFLTLITLFASLFACRSNDEGTQPVAKVEARTVTNLHAPQSTDYTSNPPKTSGDFVKFKFSTGEKTTDEKDWDIAFRGTTILVNGGASSGMTSEPKRTGNAGAYITNNTFDKVTSVEESSFTQDSANGLAIKTGSKNGWYIYNSDVRTISPIAGKVLVFRTADGKYAKMEILSYYKDSDSSNPQGVRYYTFNYVYQSNEGLTTF